VRDFSLTDSGITAETDWLLEGSGFEPSVPRKVPVVVLVSVLVRADFSVSGESSGGDMPLETSLVSRRYRRFESGFLQQRVCLSSEPPASTRRTPRFRGARRVHGDVRSDVPGATRHRFALFL
jgi:hypothetical protein